MPMEELDGELPKLEDVMRGMDTMPSRRGGKDEDDDLLLDDKPFDPFAKDDDEDRLENDPARKAQRKEDVVFEVAEDDDDGDGDEDEFKDTRKKADPRKMGRLQREMKLKAEARDQLAALGQHVNRMAAETTEAMRSEMRARRGIAELAKNTAVADIRRLENEIKTATENGDAADISRISRQQAEAEAIILKADALLDRYHEDKVSKFVYDPKIPEQLRDVNGGGTSKGRDWIDANSAWFKNPDKYGGEIAFAREVDAQLVREKKFDPGSDAFYEELTRRVALKMRDIDVYTPDGRLARVGERKRGGSKMTDTTGSSSGGRGNQSRNPDNGGKKEILSAEEQKFLRNMGVDLGKEDHLKELKANRIR